MARFHRRGRELVPFTAQEEAEWDARDALSLEKTVNRHRKTRKDDVRDEGNRRIAVALGTNDPDIEFLVDQIVEMARYIRLVRREANGTITAPQLAALNTIEQQYANDIPSIRTAQRNAILALDAVGTNPAMTEAQRVADIDSVTPVWP